MRGPHQHPAPQVYLGGPRGWVLQRAGGHACPTAQRSPEDQAACGPCPQGRGWGRRVCAEPCGWGRLGMGTPVLGKGCRGQGPAAGRLPSASQLTSTGRCLLDLQPQASWK